MTKGAENNDLIQGDKQQAVLMPLLQAAEESSKQLSVVRSIVMKALAEPALFCGYDQIKAALQATLASNNNGPEAEKLSQTLDLFSYGTFLQYQSNPTFYLDLTGAQLVKLKQLSALTVVQKACADGFKSTTATGKGVAMIPYEEFEKELQLTESNPRQVEDVLVSCLYQGVLHGKLCQQSRSIHLSPYHPILSRDVPPSQIAALIKQVKAVQASIVSATGTLEAQKQAALEDIDATHIFWKQVEDRRKKNETSMRWDGDGFGTEGGTRRQKRGRAAAASADPTAVFARYQA